MANPIQAFMNLSNTKKITFVVVLAAAISALAVLAMWAGQPEYQTLYAKISDEDSAQVIEHLQEKKIPYKVSGSSISVPKEFVHETRLELAGAGVLKGGGVGFEIFDKTGFGVTEFVQKVNYMRALQGELARTISGLAEVESARVHIVTPEKRLFSTENDAARASVVLKLTNGRTLSPEKVQSVVNLVSGSIEDLSPDNVTVIDTSGRLFTKAAGDDSISTLTSNQLEYQRTVEKGIEQRVQGILEPVVGAGKVIARVSAELDFKQVEKTEERFDPESVAVRSEQLSKEKTTGLSTGGVPGVVSNIPGESAGAKPVQPSQAGSQRQNETINYEISKVVSRTVEPVGIVKRLSVAVLVDGSYKAGEAGTAAVYAPRSEAEIKQFDDLIRGVVGFSVDRGDTIEVVNIPFEAQAPTDVEMEKESFLDKYLSSIIRYGTILVLAVIVLFFVVRPLMKGLLKAEQPALAGGFGGGSLPPEAYAALGEGEARGIGEARMPEIARPITPEAKKKKDVRDMAKQNPQQAANILKSWIRRKGEE